MENFISEALSYSGDRLAYFVSREL